MNTHILGIATAVPKHHALQTDAAQQASQLAQMTEQQQRLMTALYLRSGVEKRHSVLLTSSSNGQAAEQSFYASDAAKPAGPTTAERMAVYDKFSGDLATQASRAALTDAGVAPSDITHVVTVSCSGFSAPGFDLAIVRDLPLRSDVCRTHIGFMGCHGALNGLRSARAFAESAPGSCVLVCALELCSLHHQYHWQPDQIVANALFADGAAAAVVRAGRDSDSDSKPLMIVDFRSEVLPESVEFIQWHIGNNGFQMSLSPQLPRMIERTLGPWLQAWLGRDDLSIDQIGSWAVHPGGPRILEACAAAIRAEQGVGVRGQGTGGSGAATSSNATATLPVAILADSEAVLAEFGNMSSPTVLFILDRLRRRDAPRPIVSLAFGPGVAIEAVLLR